LSSNSLRVTYTSGSKESGKLVEYRSAPGYILLKRPDSLRLVVQNPLTKTAILDLLSVGNDFCVWSPRENTFYTGHNNSRKLVARDSSKAHELTIRPAHILEAVLPTWMPVASPDTRIAAKQDEAGDGAMSYLISVFKEGGDSRLIPIRDIWIERTRLTIARQQVYLASGERASIIEYLGHVETDGFLLPLEVRMDRPLDGYLMDMQFRSWRVNPHLPDSAFVLEPPEGARRVQFEEEGRSEVS